MVVVKNWGGEVNPYPFQCPNCKQGPHKKCVKDDGTERKRAHSERVDAAKKAIESTATTELDQ
jgi:hypothetical protein